MELIYQMKGRFIKAEKFGCFPEGERINYHYIGDVGSSEIWGSCRGINYEIKESSQVHIHIHEVLTTDQGEKILIERVGSSHPLTDEKSIVVRNGNFFARTNSQRLDWINSARLFWEGDFVTDDRHFVVKVYQK